MKRDFDIIRHLEIFNATAYCINLHYRVPHIHNDLELNLLLSGSAEINWNGKSRIIKSGEIFLFNPHEIHELRAIESDGCVIYAIQFSLRAMEQIHAGISSVIFTYNCLADILNHQQYADLYEAMLYFGVIYFQKEEYYELACQSTLFHILHLLLKNVPSENTKKNQDLAIKLTKITEFIENQYYSTLFLADIAKEFGFSPSYLSHLFKKEMGMSFQDYIMQIRYEKARYLIEHTALSLTDIYISCGFSNIRYLNKIYLKELGYSPKEYRQNHKDLKGTEDIDAKNAKRGTIQTSFSGEYCSHFLAKHLDAFRHARQIALSEHIKTRKEC